MLLARSGHHAHILAPSHAMLHPKLDRRIPMNPMLPTGCILAVLILPASTMKAQVPDAIAVADAPVAIVHAQGAQIYECKADAAGKLAWEFREPIATLLKDGKTVGQHYAGPNWGLADGSAVVGKLVGRAPGATAKDIPLLKLDVVARRGAGQLANVATIQRLNTKGGVAEGRCEKDGSFLSVPYSADYAFYEKSR
jgi:hypothetical protein